MLTELVLPGRARFIAPVVVAVALSGCAGTLNPIVQIDRQAASADTQSIHNDPPSLGEAVAYAELTRQAYRGRINDQMVLENATALALIPASALALFYGVTSASSDVVLGLGLGGAGLFAGSRYLTSKLQQHVYAAGAVALGCAVDGVAGLRAANVHLDELRLLVEGASELQKARPNVTSLHQDVSELTSTLSRLRTRLSETNSSEDAIGATLANADAAVKTGRGALERGREAILILETAGSTLWLTVSRIQSEVDKEIIDARPDLGTFVAGLSQGLFDVGGQLTAQPALFAAPSGGSDKNQKFGAADIQPLVDTARELTTSVNRKSSRVASLTEKIEERPSTEALQRCHVDVDASGASFAVMPSGELTVDADGADVTTDLRVSGGVPAYFVSRIGQAPAAGGIQASVPDTHGRFTITVAKGTTVGRYSVLVTDSAKGRQTVFVVVGSSGTSDSGNTGRGDVEKKSGDKPDPVVVRIQQNLADIFNGDGGVEVAIKDGNTVKKVKKKIEVDGKWGPVTAAGARQHLMDEGMAAAEVPTDETELKNAILKAF